MTKRKSTGVKPRIPIEDRTDPRRGEAPRTDAISRHLPTPAAIRETVESIVIAFVLAFLFRTFEAEAFVIPTGSMAPTLMGRHKDLTCPKCGCPYRVSASEEVNTAGALRGSPFRTMAGTCPMCRYTDSVAKAPSYNGDRILVSKFAYEFADPDRFDVIVFKFPGDATTDATTNFIKRLVGLPGETVRIKHGNVWIRRGEGEFQIARKPPQKLLAMLQPVFDNDYMPRIAQYGWPARWRPEPAGDGSAAGAWTSDDDATFRTDGTADREQWLHYHHVVPSYRQWATAERAGDRAPPSLTPQLITDFTAYNTGRTQRESSPAPTARGLGLYWVGDLALRSTADVESEKGALVFELCKGGRQFQCSIDVATGQATLSISGRDMEEFHPTAMTNVRGPGRHEIRFSNCDNELRLWVDGSVAQFDAPTSYDDLDNTLPDASDYSPVGVATVGAKARLSHLAIFRDIYYIADNLAYAEGQPLDPGHSRASAGKAVDETLVRNRKERQVDFPLKADQFFVLGDNSAMSKDGREWGPDNYWVPRDLLIGKALLLYWPHSWNKVPYVNVPFPFFPNFGRMGLVR